MATPPNLPPKSVYNDRLPGVYGEFGSGAALQAFYLQTSIKPAILSKISLVKDIPGSERWRVRDLFQREVDDERVSSGLVPYLQDRSKIRFFNSLILTVLPIDERSGRVLDQMPRVERRSEKEANRDWTVLERHGFFRVRWITGQQEYAELEWNSDRSRIVAIDGQHRLSALKRLQRGWTESNADSYGESGRSASHGGGHLEDTFLDWRIPIVLVSFRAAEGRVEPPSVLEVVRSIFVHINTKAQKVGRAREVLLDDESVNCIAAQEFLERAHENDVRPRAERRRETMPLLLFDWRGLEREGKPVEAPAAVKSVVEIRDWLEHYILGDDFSVDMEAALGVHGADELKRAFSTKALDYSASRLVRQRVREHVLPALAYLLENFGPYRRYIEELRKLEDRYDSGNDLQHQAFDRLRFGSSGEEAVHKALVDEVETALVAEIEAIREACLLPARPIDEDVGMRGVVQAFGDLTYQFGYPDWMEYAGWFTEGLNTVYVDGWFEAEYGGRAYGHLRHVVLDQNERVVNYRLQHAEKALGPYVSLLVGTYMPPPDHWGADWVAVENGLLGALRNTVVRGYKKEVRPELREEYPNGGRELTLAVNAKAEKMAGRQMRRLERELERIARSER